MSPPLFLLCGPAFSGKSTVAGHLARRWGFQVVSLDAINARRGLHGGDGIPDAEWVRTVAMAREEVRGLLSTSAGRVVVDDTLCFRFLRDDLRAVARSAGCDTVLLVLPVTDDEVRSRVARNARQPGRRGINAGVLERHLATFEWPGADEPHRAVTDLPALDAWLSLEAARW